MRREWITATVGIGTNLYLAKVAMDIVAKKSPADKDGVRMFVDYEALERDRRLTAAMLEVRRRFGANAVFKGMNMLEGATTLERNSQIGGHKA